MKINLKLKIFFIIIGLLSSNLIASNDNIRELHTNSAFIAKQNRRIIKTVGKCDDRQFPYSTFKVALALMGFDAGILERRDSPKWSFKEEYEKNF